MHHNSLIETIWFVVPILIVIALLFLQLKLYTIMKTTRKDKDPLVVYAVSAGYKWFFAYPDQHIETVNTLTILKIDQLYSSFNLWIQ